MRSCSERKTRTRIVPPFLSFQIYLADIRVDADRTQMTHSRGVRWHRHTRQTLSASATHSADRVAIVVLEREMQITDKRRAIIYINHTTFPFWFRLHGVCAAGFCWRRTARMINVCVFASFRRYNEPHFASKTFIHIFPYRNETTTSDDQ